MTIDPSSTPKSWSLGLHKGESFSKILWRPAWASSPFAGLLSTPQLFEFHPDFFHQPLRHNAEGSRQSEHDFQRRSHLALLQTGDIAVIQAARPAQVHLRPSLPQASSDEYVRKGTPDLVNLVQTHDSIAALRVVPLRIIQLNRFNPLTPLISGDQPDSGLKSSLLERKGQVSSILLAAPLTPPSKTSSSGPRDEYTKYLF